MSTSVPHQTAALLHIGQLQRVAALKATQEMLKHNRIVHSTWVCGNQLQRSSSKFFTHFGYLGTRKHGSLP